MKLTINDTGKYYLVQSRKDSIFYSKQFLYKALEDVGLIFMRSLHGHQTLIEDDERVIREVDKDTHPWWKMVDGELKRNL